MLGSPISLLDTCHLSHQLPPLSPQSEEFPQRAKYSAPTQPSGLPLIPLSSPTLQRPRDKQHNGVLKPTMQMASFVLPGVTRPLAVGWGRWGSLLAQLTPSLTSAPTLCAGPQKGERGEEGGEEEAREARE